MGDVRPVNGGHFLPGPARNCGKPGIDLQDLTGLRADQRNAHGRLFEHGPEQGLGPGNLSQSRIGTGAGGSQLGRAELGFTLDPSVGIREGLFGRPMLRNVL